MSSEPLNGSMNKYAKLFTNGVAVGVGVGLIVGVGVGVEVGVIVGVGVGPEVADGVGVGVGLGIGTGNGFLPDPQHKELSTNDSKIVTNNSSLKGKITEP